MPARTVNQSVRDLAEVSARVVQLAGMADDPIAYVRCRWGALVSTTRVLTMQVIDRLDKPYSPHSYEGYKRRAGTYDGRWIVAWYVAASKFGTPVSSAGAYTAGKEFTDLSGFTFSETDADGKIEVEISKGVEEVWIHAGVVGLLRARGINWTELSSSGDPGAGEGTSGGGEITGHE